jgi:hypothetical protein
MCGVPSAIPIAAEVTANRVCDDQNNDRDQDHRVLTDQEGAVQDPERDGTETDEGAETHAEILEMPH